MVQSSAIGRRYNAETYHTTNKIHMHVCMHIRKLNSNVMKHRFHFIKAEQNKTHKANKKVNAIGTHIISSRLRTVQVQQTKIKFNKYFILFPLSCDRYIHLYFLIFALMHHSTSYSRYPSGLTKNCLPCS